MKWLRVSISLSGELAEPVSDLLSRHAPGGISLEAAPPSTGPQKGNEVILNAYLAVDDTLDERRTAIEEGLWHLEQIQKIPQPHFQVIDEEDWGNSWKSHYHPITIGKRLVIQPAWLPLGDTDRLPLIMDPGMAFGTGTHPTTQLCLEALEDHVQAGKSVIDLGCGSGILSIAAARLGASRILALDIDPIAVQCTQENAARNGVSKIIHVREGSLDSLLSEAVSDQVPTSLVLANILAKTLEDMLRSGLGEVIIDEGTLILSGILDHQVSSIGLACDEVGLRLVDSRAMDDWRALIIKRMPSS